MTIGTWQSTIKKFREQLINEINPHGSAEFGFEIMKDNKDLLKILYDFKIYQSSNLYDEKLRQYARYFYKKLAQLSRDTMLDLLTIESNVEQTESKSKKGGKNRNRKKGKNKNKGKSNDRNSSNKSSQNAQSKRSTKVPEAFDEFDPDDFEPVSCQNADVSFPK